MDKLKAKQILEAALIKFVRIELALDRGFPTDIGERPMMFRLAHYLIEGGAEDGGLCVDCDYNRHLGAVKTMLPVKAEFLPADGRVVHPKRFFPDMVLHERRSDRRNVLVCEIKRIGDRRRRDVDHCRLSKLTMAGGEYGYELGAFVEINQADRLVSVKYFERGVPTGTFTTR